MAIRTLFLIILYGRMFNCDSPHNNQCKQTCNGEKCDLRCHGAHCKKTFNNAQTEPTLNHQEKNCVQTCNKGNCSLECSDRERCKQTCHNENGKCTLNCSGQRCDQTCDKGNCSLICNGGEHCEQKCDNNNGRCTLNCHGERCNQTCQGGKCSLECHGNHCTQTCKSGKCTLKCHGEICKQKCNRDCMLECRGITCTQDCSEVRDSCQLKCPVLSGEKVCQQNCQGKDRLCTKIVIATTTKAPTTSTQLNHFCTALLKSSSSTSTLSMAPSLTVSTALQSSSSSEAFASTRSSSMAGMSVTATEIPLVTAAKDASDKSQNNSRTEELVKDVISAFNRTDPKQETSLQNAVNLLQNTTEQLRNMSHLITEQKREGSIFKVLAAFEEFSLKFGHYHLNESMPQLRIKNSGLVLHIQRFFHRDAGDFILKGTEKHNFMNISSKNFLNNDSLLVAVLYKDLHELLQSNPSNDDAPTNNKRIDSIIMAATMDPKPEKLLQNITLKFKNLKFADAKRYCVFWSDYSKEK